MSFLNCIKGSSEIMCEMHHAPIHHPVPNPHIKTVLEELRRRRQEEILKIMSKPHQKRLKSLAISYHFDACLPRLILVSIIIQGFLVNSEIKRPNLTGTFFHLRWANCKEKLADNKGYIYSLIEKRLNFFKIMVMIWANI